MHIICCSAELTVFFKFQEPAGEDEVAQFCSRNYGVTFDMFSKIDVNGSNADPLFNYLKKEQKGTLGK